MANLKDLEVSQRGTQIKEPVVETVPPSITASETYRGEQRFVIFKMLKKRRRVWLDGICDNVKNPKTGKRERIYLLNGAHSIWQSDLKDLLQDKEYVKRNRRSIPFEDGIAMVRSDDERALEFARACNHNVQERTGHSNGKYDFYEYDAAKEQEERYKKQLLKIDMVIKAKEMPEDKMRKLASFFGVSFVDELGMPKTSDGIRQELMLKADNNPSLFEKYIDSREVEVSYMVKKAIIDAKIDLTGQMGNAIWAGGKGFICKIPAGRKAYEYLTELAMTNSEDGKNFKSQLESLVV